MQLQLEHAAAPATSPSSPHVFDELLEEGAHVDEALDVVDVVDEQLGITWCRRCRQQTATRNGYVQAHHPGVGRVDLCPAVGTRIATSMRPLAALAFMAGAVRARAESREVLVEIIDVDGRAKLRSAEVELGPGAIEAIKILGIKWIGTRKQPHAALQVDKHVVPILAASISRLKASTLEVLGELPLQMVLWRACAALELAVLSPIAFLGGISDVGRNPWGALALVLPFDARARKAGCEGKAYTARWLRIAFASLADSELAYRFPRKVVTGAKGFTSTRTSASGAKWASTGKVYSIIDGPSATYLATDPLRDLQVEDAHKDWARAIREVIRERFGWAWGLTRRSRNWRRGYTYQDALITHPQEKQERKRDRAIKRKHWAKVCEADLIPAQRIALREKNKNDPAKPGGAVRRSRDDSHGLDPPHVPSRAPEELKGAFGRNVSSTATQTSTGRPAASPQTALPRTNDTRPDVSTPSECFAFVRALRREKP